MIPTNFFNDYLIHVFQVELKIIILYLVTEYILG